MARTSGYETRVPRQPLAAWGRWLNERLRRTRMVVALLGARGHGLEERRTIARELRRRGILVLIPEDDLPPEIAPSLAEVSVLAQAEVDLVFLNVQSWGSATELGQFHRDPEIARKLRVLVPPEHHPFHGGDRGYLADLYLTHLAVFGHVYPVDGARMAPVAPASEVVLTLSERHRQLKALNLDFIK